MSHCLWSYRREMFTGGPSDEIEDEIEGTCASVEAVTEPDMYRVLCTIPDDYLELVATHMIFRPPEVASSGYALAATFKG